MTLDKGGDVTMTYPFVFPTTNKGTWGFADDKMVLLITVFPTCLNCLPIEVTQYTILKLEEKELWLKFFNILGNVFEYHFVPA